MQRYNTKRRRQGGDARRRAGRSRHLHPPTRGSRRPWGRAGAAARWGRKDEGRGQGAASSSDTVPRVALQQNNRQSSRAVLRAPSDRRRAYVEGFGGGSRGVHARESGSGASTDGDQRHLVAGGTRQVEAVGACRTLEELRKYSEMSFHHGHKLHANYNIRGIWPMGVEGYIAKAEVKSARTFYHHPLVITHHSVGA